MSHSGVSQKESATNHLCEFENTESGRYLFESALAQSALAQVQESESGLESVQEVVRTQESVQGFTERKEAEKQPIRTLTGTSVQSSF